MELPGYEGRMGTCVLPAWHYPLFIFSFFYSNWKIKTKKKNKKDCSRWERYGVPTAASFTSFLILFVFQKPINYVLSVTFMVLVATSVELTSRHVSHKSLFLITTSVIATLIGKWRVKWIVAFSTQKKKYIYFTSMFCNKSD